MSSTPSQIRTIDPFAEYNSNVANRLTQMISRNDDVLLSVNSMRLTQDSTSPTTVAVVQSGYAIKDNVLIQITGDHAVDFTDSNNYIAFGSGFDEVGYYYVVLEYTYVKSRPAPEMRIKIIKPSQRSGYTTNAGIIMIGIVKVINLGISQGIDLSDPFHNYDPENTANRREYAKLYAGAESNLPTHVNLRDQSRIAYDSETDKFWLGYRDSWQEFGTGGSVINIDTTGTNVGQLCYVDASGTAVPSISTAFDTGADVVVQAVGTALDSSGKALTSGIAENVPIETAIVVTTGDLLYLSASDPGTVTTVKPTDTYQVVGRALTSGDSANPIDIIFTPKVVLNTSVAGNIPSVTGWDGSAGVYFHDIDITSLDVENDYAVLTGFFDGATDTEMWPDSVELRDAGATLRVWMNVNTTNIYYIISTGGGGTIGVGGGGGGTADHSLLLNLDYGSSGHTGFTPNPHDNAYHSDTYLTSSGVTYEALLANADIGTGATQVAQGNHNHALTGGGSIPAGTIMVFKQAAAPVGWTLVNTGYNNNSMLVLGNSYAQGGSADARSFNPAVSAVANGGHSHTTGSHTLSLAEIPSHRHPAESGQHFVSYTGGGIVGPGDKARAISNTGYAGGGGSHNHGSTSYQSSHNHTINYSSYSPYYSRLIPCSKD